MTTGATISEGHTLLLSIAMCVPIFFSIIMLISPRQVMIKIAPWAALPALLAALIVPLDTTVEWSGIILGARFGIDINGQIFLFFTALLWLLAGIFGVHSLASDARRQQFFQFYLLAMSGNIGLILALDMASFYTFFTLLSFSSYGLIMHTRTPEAFQAGRIYIYFVALSELMLFAGFVLLAAQMGNLTLPVIAGLDWSNLIIAFIFVGFGIKAGIVPLHVWLPLAHPVAPTAASAVLSGAIIKAGILGWLRFFPLGDVAWPLWGLLFLFLGFFAAFFAAIAGATQHNPKTVLAYSSVSQVGLILLCFGVGVIAPESWASAKKTVLLYVLHHSLAKGALFLGVSVAEAASINSRKWVMAGLLIPALALAGAPFTSGMIAKAAFKPVAQALPGQWGTLFYVFLSLTAIGTTLLMARFLYLVWPRKTTQAQLAPGLWLPWAALTAATATVIFVLPAAAKSGQGLFASIEWAGTIWPVFCGSLIALAVWFFSRNFRLSHLNIPAGDVLVLAKPVGALLLKTWQYLQRSVSVLKPQLAAGVLNFLYEKYNNGSLPTSAEHFIKKWKIFSLLFLSLTITIILLLIMNA